jgi:hypothetical protein
MKNLFRSTFVLALIAGGFALTATAQKPTLVRNDAEPGRTPYQQTFFILQNASNCDSAQDCRINLPAVPAGFRLVINHVSVMFHMAPGGTGAYATLQTNSFGPGTVAFLTASPINATTYLISTPMTYFVEPGETPVIVVQGNDVDRTGYGAEATVSGYLVSIP